MAPAGFLRFYYQGQEFEIAEPDWSETFKGHAEAAQQDHEQVIAAGGLFILARSGTSRGASTTSFAGARDDRAIPVNRDSICLSKTT